MNSPKKIILGLLISFLCGCKLFGQETPEQLGIEFLNSLKSNDLIEIKKIIPETDILLGYAEKIGLHYNKEEKAEFLKTRPNENKQFLNKINQLKLFGERLGVDWKFVEFQNVVVDSSEQKLPGLDKPIFVTNLSVMFKHTLDSYQLDLKYVFEYDNIWYLADDKPRLKRK